MRTFARPLFHASVAIAVLVAVVVLPERSAAEPNFTLDPASPSLAAIPATPKDILNPFTGTPVWGGQPLPAVILTGAPGLGLPGAAVLDDFSYGDEIPAAGLALGYSVNRAAVGFPVAGNALAAEAGAPEGAVGADLYTPAGPLLPGPCALPPGLPNALLTDGNGTTGAGAPLRLGLGLDELPAFTPASQDNISGLELENYGGGAVYFTVDVATAGLMGITPGTVMAYFPPGPVPVVWAIPGMLGLGPFDDIDALTVGNAPPLGGGMGAGDYVFFSLKPGSPALAALPHCGFFPGPSSPGDVWFSVGAGAFPAVDAEELGLATVRSGTAAVDDNLDALDFVSVLFPVDTDLDSMDDAIDFDDDNDQLSDSREIAIGCNPLMADTDGDGLSDYQEVVVTGTNCTLKDTDGDNCNDMKELGPSHFVGGERNPLVPWDFDDVPTPALRINPLGMRDGGIGITTDIVALLKYVGLTSGSADYIADYDGNGQMDGLQYDRALSTTLGMPWRSNGPDGGIGITTDVVAMLAQVGNTC